MQLSNAKRLVIKVGSSIITDEAKGEARIKWLTSLAADIAALKKVGKEIIIVTSGAVALGRKVLQVSGKLTLEQKQAAAAIGQVPLMHAWQQCLEGHHIHVAQLLLTVDESENRRRYLNAQNTLETLIEQGIIPVINENDTVATAELRFGDNDRLAARVAQMASADTLIVLSDVDGLYSADPSKDKNAKHIPELREITADVEAMAGASASGVGTGGMATKLAAAKIALNAGCNMLIASGKSEHPISKLQTGEARCTRFIAPATPMSARKHWISGSIAPTGAIVVDAGAAKALSSGKSLLPAGVKKLEGKFERGDAVLIKDESGHILGKGLVAYSAEDARLIIGKKSADIEAILGYKGRDNLIHRNDMVLE